MSTSIYNPETLQDVLPLYYKRLFPYDQYHKWLSYGNDEYLSRREFSFTFFGDIYVRYQSFDNQEGLINMIQKKCPEKIDIGAVFNIKPKNQRRADAFIAIEKEVVFDIDMTDYDEVRTCCSGADVCHKCWKFMAIACKILDAALREDFNFQNLLWVFSGRRGIHCWVCDEAARKLQTNHRNAIAEYLTLIRGGTQKAKKVNFPGDKLHHSVERALKIVESYFVDVCLTDQEILGTEPRLDEFLKLIPIADKDDLKKDMLQYENSKDRWDTFSKYYEKQRSKGNLKKNKHLIEEIMFQYLYPRLDINVTKGLNHLLKSPFCVHPKSGKISIPFNPTNVDKFSPLTVPTISVLVEEINSFDEQLMKENETDNVPSPIGNKIKDYKKTSLYKAIVVFENFVRKLEHKSAKESLDF